ncbi:cell division protein [Enterococcus faecalis]|nr:cell division protein [Enterococcus faecalis]
MINVVCFSKYVIIKKKIERTFILNKKNNTFSCFLNNYKNLILSIGIILLTAFLIISAQLFRHSIILGSDNNFFMNKIYESYMQQKTGTYNYFQSVYGFQQSGRIINAVYAPDFSFILGGLLAIAKNWFRFQVLSGFFCLFSAGISMFVLGRYCKITYKYSVSMSLLYMSTSAISVFITSEASSGWASAILPLVFIPAIKMVTDSSRPIQPVLLSLPVVLIINLHVFSTFLVILALIPFFIIGIFKTKDKLKMLIDAFLAALLTLLLTSRLITGMLEVFTTNQLLKPYSVDKMLPYSMKVSLDVQGWSSLGIFFTIIFLFLCILTIFNWTTIPFIEKVLNSIGLFFLLISSNLLPWDDIPRLIPIIQGIQFPQRFASVSFVLLILSFTLFLQRISFNKFHLYSYSTIIYMTVSILSCLLIHQAILSSANTWHSNKPLSNDSSSLKTKINDMTKVKELYGGKNELGDPLKVVIKPLTDYLPINNQLQQKESPYTTYWNEVANSNLKVAKHVLSDGRLQLNWTNESNESVETLLPAIAYSRSELWLNEKKLSTSQYKTSTIGSIILQAVPGKNSLVLGYKPTTAFIITKYVQNISYICLVLYLIYAGIYKIKKRH